MSIAFQRPLPVEDQLLSEESSNEAYYTSSQIRADFGFGLLDQESIGNEQLKSQQCEQEHGSNDEQEFNAIFSGGEQLPTMHEDNYAQDLYDLTDDLAMGWDNEDLSHGHGSDQKERNQGSIASRQTSIRRNVEVDSSYGLNCASHEKYPACEDELLQHIDNICEVLHDPEDDDDSLMCTKPFHDQNQAKDSHHTVTPRKSRFSHRDEETMGSYNEVTERIDHSDSLIFAFDNDPLITEVRRTGLSNQNPKTSKSKSCFTSRNEETMGSCFEDKESGDYFDSIRSTFDNDPFVAEVRRTPSSNQNQKMTKSCDPSHDNFSIQDGVRTSIKASFSEESQKKLHYLYGNEEVHRKIRQVRAGYNHYHVRAFRPSHEDSFKTNHSPNVITPKIMRPTFSHKPKVGIRHEGRGSSNCKSETDGYHYDEDLKMPIPTRYEHRNNEVRREPIMIRNPSNLDSVNDKTRSALTPNIEQKYSIHMESTLHVSFVAGTSENKKLAAGDSREDHFTCMCCKKKSAASNANKKRKTPCIPKEIELEFQLQRHCFEQGVSTLGEERGHSPDIARLTPIKSCRELATQDTKDVVQSVLQQDQNKTTVHSDAPKNAEKMCCPLNSSISDSDDSQGNDIVATASIDSNDDTYNEIKMKHDVWTKQYNNLCEFRKLKGHCIVPFSYKEDPALAHWVKRQRYHMKLMVDGSHNYMIPERRKALEAIDFCWHPHEEVWFQRFGELKQFKEKFGTCNVPIKGSDNQKLAIWVKGQRRQYKLLKEGKPSSMSNERVKKLEDVGFEWQLRNGRNCRRAH